MVANVLAVHQGEPVGAPATTACNHHRNNKKDTNKQEQQKAIQPATTAARNRHQSFVLCANCKKKRKLKKTPFLSSDVCKF